MNISTPIHIIDLDRLLNNLSGPIAKIRESTACNFLFAIKGFSSPNILPYMFDYLDGISASGLFEARLGRECIKKHVCTYSPAYKDDEILSIVKLSNSVIFNSIEQFSKYSVIAKNYECSCGIRINPEFSFFEDSYKVNPCQKHSRLGITYQFMPPLYMFDKEKIEGIHLHIMNAQNADALEKTINMLIDRYEPYLKRIKWLNLGGGQLFSNENYNIDQAISSINKLRQKYDCKIYLEPCTGIVTGCGYFVTSIIDIIKNGIEIAIIDGSAVCHLPDVVFDDWKHDIYGASSCIDSYQNKYRIAGPSCYPGDVWGDYSFPKPLSIGEKIIFKDTAMYSMVKSSYFNGINLPSLAIFQKNKGLKILKTYDYKTFINCQ